AGRTCVATTCGREAPVVLDSITTNRTATTIITATSAARREMGLRGELGAAKTIFGAAGTAPVSCRATRAIWIASAPRCGTTSAEAVGCSWSGATIERGTTVTGS